MPNYRDLVDSLRQQGHGFVAAQYVTTGAASTVVGFELFNPSNNPNHIIVHSIVIECPDSGNEAMYKATSLDSTLTQGMVITNDNFNMNIATGVQAMCSPNSVTTSVTPPATLLEPMNLSANTTLEILQDEEYITLAPGTGVYITVNVTTSGHRAGCTFKFVD